MYCYGGYQDEARRITRGHSEDNLKQINTFYVDFDDRTLTNSAILVASLDLGFMPTAIVKTERGYQVYFVLSSPAYVTARTDYQVIKVAKTISQNIRNYFQKEGLPVDKACNHFGIARLPIEDNLEFYEPSYVYSFDEWLWWSLKQETAIKPKTNLTVLSGSDGLKQTDEPWFKLLLCATNIRGHKALLGRNNALFTLALACYGSGMAEQACRLLLGSFLERLEEPLSQIEFDKTIKSAYSGRYEAASRDYILSLCRAWVSPDLRPSDLFSYQRWYKFKKPRDQRVKSHLWEWEADVLDYLEKISFEASPFIQT
ncbi:primase C-terminal domain-containing protein, partial [Streptococcus sp. S784/96/1]|uniref:primase C-terminal domain-containing protein n=1 Tax=Streptococcus sp. S784/96/1 TaxID=2653499 RepID=UPI001EE3F5B2